MCDEVMTLSATCHVTCTDLYNLKIINVEITLKSDWRIWLKLILFIKVLQIVFLLWVTHYCVVFPQSHGKCDEWQTDLMFFTVPKHQKQWIGPFQLCVCIFYSDLSGEERSWTWQQPCLHSHLPKSSNETCTLELQMLSITW